LTSGYFPGEDRAFVNGKCHHGGLLDSSSLPGINKDIDSFVFSPHSDLHQVAADLATAASVQFIQDLRTSLTQPQLRLVLGLDNSGIA
jgi:hypothetical protein